VRAMVDKAIDWLINFIVSGAKKLFSKFFGKDKDKDKDKDKKPGDMTPQEKLTKAVSTATALLDGADATLESIREKLPAIQGTYGLKELALVVDGESDEDYKAHIHGALNPNGDGTKKTVPKSAKTTKIGAIEIPRESMRWKKKEKIKIARKFIESQKALGESASAVQAKTGKILTKKKYGRRHIISFGDMRTHYLAAFPEAMTVEKACAILTKFAASAGVTFTKKSVHSKVRSLCRAAFNEPSNVWIGLQSENSSLQETVDPSPAMLDKHGNRIQKLLDDHIKKFKGDWCVPGAPFVVTGADSLEGEWEIEEK